MSPEPTIPEELVDAVTRAGTPTLVGIAGPVAVGKSTLATTLTDAMRARGVTARVIGTDSYLLPNARLDELGLSMRKGFPESFDEAGLCSSLHALRERRPVRIPVYSHETYDIVSGLLSEVEPVDILVVEGVNALQPAVAALLDVPVYLDADEPVVRGWFVQRFERLTAQARATGSGFYARFAAMPPAQLKSFAEGVWDAINGPNLRDHISGTKRLAGLVVRKDALHRVIAVGPPTAV